MWISAGSWQPRENWSREATMQPVMWGELRSSLCWSSISFFLSSWSHFNVVLFHRTVAGRLDNTWKAFASGRATNLLYPKQSINLDQHQTTFPSKNEKLNPLNQDSKNGRRCLPCLPFSTRRQKATLKMLPTGGYSQICRLLSYHLFTCRSKSCEIQQVSSDIPVLEVWQNNVWELQLVVDIPITRPVSTTTKRSMRACARHTLR